MAVTYTCALFIVFHGIVFTIAGNLELNVSPEEVTVLPGSKNVTLDCYGNVKDPGYYLTHKVTWSHLSHSKQRIHITTGLRLNALKEPGYLFNHGVLDKNKTRYTFRLIIKNVTYNDDGWYICEKIHPNRSLGERKKIQVIVTRPVESVKITMHLDNGENISSGTFSTDEQTVTEIEEGKYMVSCTGTGSNPEPTMSLTFGQKRQDNVRIHFTEVILDSMRSFTGISHGHIFFERDESPKDLICEAVVTKTNFPSRMAGIRVKVNPPTVQISCRNVSALVGYKETSLECQITSNQELTCEHVHWKEELNQFSVGATTRIKHRVYGIMFTTCETLTKNDLLTKLIIYHALEIHFEKYFCVEYVKETKKYQQSVLLLRKDISNSASFQAFFFVVIIICITVQTYTVY